MKKFLQLVFIFFTLLGFGQQQTGTFSYSPSTFNFDDVVTITVSGVDPEIWNPGEPNNLYLWAWYFDHCGDFVGGPLAGNGEWEDSNNALQMTNNGDGTYSFTLTPETFYGSDNISRMGILVKADNGVGDKKTQDELKYVGNGIVVNLEFPATTPAVLNSGDDLLIRGTFTAAGTLEFGAPYEIFFNDVSQGTSSNGFPNFQFTLTNLMTSGTVKVQPTISGETAYCEFDVIIAPTVTEQAMPAGMEDGINYDSGDDTVATLVLNAPLKDFVYVAGSFNGYNPDNTYLMKKDPGSGKFWFELTGLTPGQVEHFQYWVYALNPVANSPQLVKTADPFSTLVLSNFDDPEIPASSFPGLDTDYLYPAGQFRSVTVLQTGQTTYNWQVTNFNKPKKEDLIIYEVLPRDFDENRSFQDLIDRIDYFKNLNINAIELMPIMEFENNYTWGYNTAFHMALDKFYGTPDKFKEFVDLCHQNGIAVILDIALNHAVGRNPFVRMWMDDQDNDGWGPPSSENPYLNEEARHSYSVFNDFDHSSLLTQYYTKRVIEHWINEYKIDGFRWDLTKGFTQNCTSGDEGCTNGYQADRVAILKDYADHSWLQDPDHYVIFEHLGGNAEELEWADYRIGEGKGIMLWREMFNDYKNLAQGAANTNVSGIGHQAHGFAGMRTVGYPESHDKDRLMYEMLTFGQAGIAGNLNASLKRMSAIGAVFLTVPGPKMLWHFADLGMDDSIFTCDDGSVNTDYDGLDDGDCKLSTKPQPQWQEMWLNDPNRSQVYSDWSRMIDLKINEPVFEGNYTINTNSTGPSIYVWDDTLPASQLKNIVIISNFTTTSQNINPFFPYGGTWYDLMDETGSTTIDGSTTSVNLPTGEFRVYGNALPQTLSSEEFIMNSELKLFPNPATTSFKLSHDVETIELYDLTGKLIKSFKGGFTQGDEFDVSQLSQSIYIVKAKNGIGQELTTKLIKL